MFRYFREHHPSLRARCEPEARYLQTPSSEGKVTPRPPKRPAGSRLRAWPQRQAQTLKHCFSVSCFSTRFLRQHGPHAGLQISAGETAPPARRVPWKGPPSCGRRSSPAWGLMSAAPLWQVGQRRWLQRGPQGNCSQGLEASRRPEEGPRDELKQPGSHRRGHTVGSVQAQGYTTAHQTACWARAKTPWACWSQ